LSYCLRCYGGVTVHVSPSCAQPRCMLPINFPACAGVGGSGQERQSPPTIPTHVDASLPGVAHAIVI
jgi:hypothetical protein